MNQSSTHSLPSVISFTILGTKPRRIELDEIDSSSFDSTLLSSVPTELDESPQKQWILKRASSDSSDDYWVQRAPNRSKKMCISCGTRKTPRWHTSRFLCIRPKESLCNACAIRIKKYHSMCSHCHYALNKEQQSIGICPRCKRPFSNLINEDLLNLTTNSNQLDSILATIESFVR